MKLTLKTLGRASVVFLLLVMLLWLTASKDEGLYERGDGRVILVDDRDRQFTPTEPRSSLLSSPSSLPSSSSPLVEPPFNVWVFVVIPADRGAMLNYYFHHYLSLGMPPENFYIIIHLKDETKQQQGLLETKRLLKGLRVPYSVWEGEFTTREKARVLRVAKQERGLKPRDWVLQTDSDELQQWKVLMQQPELRGVGEGGEPLRRFDTIQEVLYEVDRRNYTHIMGWMMDRLALDGSLRDPLPFRPEGPSLEEQYPLGCMVTKRIAHGLDAKVVAHKVAFPLKGGGAHMMVPNPQLRPWERKMPVHHFKFVPEMRPMLEDRVAVFKKNNISWYDESEKILQHLNQHNGKFCVSCPELNCQRKN
ncbi:hypothetical protein QOT17_015483 [Balamuthia mandrillaris]